jgi:toxin-antitoxin system PIN domain toxin
LNFPDVNVWMALVLEHHVHRKAARAWWQATDAQIAFTRFTQISLLRLLTTSAAMDGKPLHMKEAWRVHDRLFEDARVVFYPEPAEVEPCFRKHTATPTPSPKLWADAWLLAFAEATAGKLVTFDRALAGRGALCLPE